MPAPVTAASQALPGTWPSPAAGLSAGVVPAVARSAGHGRCPVGLPVPFASGPLALRAGGHGWMVSVNCWVAWLPVLSVTFIVNVNVPAVVGVPASSLLLSVGASVDTSASPGGSCPEATDHV